MDLYLATCAICHGNQREGVTGLGKPLTPESLTDYSDADLSEVIREGRADTEMQGFKDRLSSQEIDGLIQLIKHTSP